MKLIFIYGPPAAGKLTVAQALAKKTGFRVLHNHHTVDLLGSLFEWGSEPFKRLNRLIRLELIETAAKEKLPGLIFTFVYAHPDDGELVKMFIRRVRKHRGTVNFVQLTCGERVLLSRVTGGSRKKYQKLKTKSDLKKCLKTWELSSPIPFVESLCIDNTKKSPSRVANEIADHYALQRGQGRNTALRKLKQA